MLPEPFATHAKADASIMKEDAQNLRSEISDGKQEISYETEISGIAYQVTMTLDADGNGAEDTKKKLRGLLENEIRRQLNNK